MGGIDMTLVADRIDYCHMIRMSRKMRKKAFKRITGNFNKGNNLATEQERRNGIPFHWVNWDKVF